MLRKIRTLHLKKIIRKGCQIYAIQVGYSNSKEKSTTFENFTIARDFANVFPE